MQQSKIPRIVYILVAGGFIQSVGNSLLWPLNSIFMHNILGRTLTEAGIILALQSGFSLLGQFISGFLADHFGSKKIMLFGLWGTLISISFIALFPIWRVYAPAFVLFGLSQAFIVVPLNALLHTLWPEGGRRGFNLLYVFNNAGVAVGTAIGGLIAQISFRLVFSLNAVSFLIYLLLVIFGISERNTPVTMIPPKIQTERITKDRSFKVLATLALGIFLIWAAYIQWVSILPVVMTNLGFSLPAYSLLWTLNGIFVVTLQPLINKIIKLWAYSFTRQFYLSILLISISFLILISQPRYPSYIIAMLVLTLGEMLILPAVPTAAAQLAPQGKEGAYQGIVGGTSSGGRMIGPLLGGIFFDHWGGTYVWLLGLIFMGAAVAAFYLYSRFEKQFLSVTQSNIKPEEPSLQS